MKRFGFVRPNPSDFVIIIRKGKIISQGRGLSFFCLPWDQYCIIPSVVSTISFAADQITKENQGIEVKGFAIWKIGEPEKTYLHFDFYGNEDPIEKINIYLQEVVVSAIRHQVAAMSIEEVLRKRGSIILQLKEELAYIADQWGLIIETIEIKNVMIMSSQLFANMQAKYRNLIRLESETSSLKTEQEIEEKTLQQQSELERLKAKEDKASQLNKIEQELEIFEQEQLNKRKMFASEQETLDTERPLLQAQHAVESEKKMHELQLRKIDLEMEKNRILNENEKDAIHILYNKLPEIAKALNVKEINVGQDTLGEIVDALKTALVVKRNPVKTPKQVKQP